MLEVNYRRINWLENIIVDQEHRKPPPLPQAPLSYQSPGVAAGPVVKPSPYPTLIRFFWGLGLGALVSTLVYFGGWHWMDTHHTDWLIWSVPLAKLLVGITCVCIRGYRPFGAGVLVSIALGVLIFFGACIVNVDWSHMH